MEDTNSIRDLLAEAVVSTFPNTTELQSCSRNAFCIRTDSEAEGRSAIYTVTVTYGGAITCASPEVSA